jgi:hypothetical protein
MIKSIKDLNADVVKLKRFFTERNLHGPETTFPKRYMERHLRYEFLFILEGTAEYAFNGTMAELQPGDGILIRDCAAQNNAVMLTSLDTVRMLLDVLEEVTMRISTIDAG